MFTENSGPPDSELEVGMIFGSSKWNSEFKRTAKT